MWSIMAWVSGQHPSVFVGVSSRILLHVVLVVGVVQPPGDSGLLDGAGQL